MYGSNDLSASRLFSGHFINFGYWTDGITSPITTEQRTASQADLYRVVLRRAEIGRTDTALEVGCGIGVGAALAMAEFGPHEFVGLDISADQLARAQRINADALAAHRGRLSFRQGSALSMPVESTTFDICLSIEAAQHFEDLAGFAAEANRALKPGGTLVLTTFFTTTDDAADRLEPLIETIRTGIDVVTPIDCFATALRTTGFGHVEIEAIGEHVWHGYDAWMRQVGFENRWCRNWLRAYEDGLLDYYLISAVKSPRPRP